MGAKGGGGGRYARRERANQRRTNGGGGGGGRKVAERKWDRRPACLPAAPLPSLTCFSEVGFSAHSRFWAPRETLRPPRSPARSPIPPACPAPAGGKRASEREEGVRPADRRSPFEDRPASCVCVCAAAPNTPGTPRTRCTSAEVALPYLDSLGCAVLCFALLTATSLAPAHSRTPSSQRCLGLVVLPALARSRCPGGALQLPQGQRALTQKRGRRLAERRPAAESVLADNVSKSGWPRVCYIGSAQNAGEGFQSFLKTGD